MRVDAVPGNGPAKPYRIPKVPQRACEAYGIIPVGAEILFGEKTEK
jgi:hypothetical protein